MPKTQPPKPTTGPTGPPLLREPFISSPGPSNLLRCLGPDTRPNLQTSTREQARHRRNLTHPRSGGPQRTRHSFRQPRRPRRR